VLLSAVVAAVVAADRGLHRHHSGQRHPAGSPERQHVSIVGGVVGGASSRSSSCSAPTTAAATSPDGPLRRSAPRPGSLVWAKFGALSSLHSFPRIPLKQGTLTGAGIITLIALLVVSLIGALLGELA